MQVEPINQLVTLTDSGLTMPDGLLVRTPRVPYPPLGEITNAGLAAWAADNGVRVGLRVVRLGRQAKPAPLVLRVYTTATGPYLTSDPVTGFVGPLVTAPAGLVENISMHWGDGDTETGVDLSGQTYLEHTYAEPGTYRIAMRIDLAQPASGFSYSPYAWADVTIE